MIKSAVSTYVTVWRRLRDVLKGEQIVTHNLILGAGTILASLLVAAGAGMPFTLALPLLIGAFQGEQRFLALSLILVGQAAAKLIAALALGAVWGSFGIIAGISLAGALVYVTAYLMLSRGLSIKSSLPWLRSTVS